MTNSNEIENEIDAIRDTICLTTKEKTAQERLQYINSRAHEILKKQQRSKYTAVHLQQV
jgi:hypothetical protein